MSYESEVSIGDVRYVPVRAQREDRHSYGYTGGPDGMKLFIAFHLADTTRDRCAGVQQDLFERIGRAATTILRPVPAEKMHVTAVFIGEVDRRTADQIGAVFHDCIASLRGVGRFGMESGGTAHLPSLSIGGVGA
ncbi:MAG: 2'-5' RNA ligase family protein, partial [Alkalispirochaeta sp.]